MPNVSIRTHILVYLGPTAHYALHCQISLSSSHSLGRD